jgi:hypothetical protein
MNATPAAEQYEEFEQSEQNEAGSNLACTASHLEQALRRKIGHTVVIGEDRYDVNIFVSVVLGDLSGYQIIEFSAEDLELPDLHGLYGGARTIAVIYDADLLTTTTLEELRVWAENSLVGLGLLLVGTSVLERTLAKPEVKVFNLLVHSRIALQRNEFETTVGQPARSRTGIFSSFIVAGIVALCAGFALGTQTSSQDAFVGALSDSVANGVAWISTYVK